MISRRIDIDDINNCPAEKCVCWQCNILVKEIQLKNIVGVVI